MAIREGVPARLIERALEIELDWLAGAQVLGLTAGASAPEVLVEEVLERLGTHFDLQVEEAEHVPEGLTFKLPRELVS